MKGGNVAKNCCARKTRNRSFSILNHMVSGVWVFLADLLARLACLNCSNVLHTNMLCNVLRLPLAFMDVTPAGRILSRFSKDVDTLDNSLPFEISDLIYCLSDVRF